MTMPRRSVSRVRRTETIGKGRSTAKRSKAPVPRAKAGPGRKPQKGTRRDTFARLRRGGGMGVAVTVVEGAADVWDEHVECYEVVATRKGGLSGGAVGRLKRVLPRMAPTLAALGHADRARIMAKLLEGPATYRALQNLTKMQAGPLYYHLGELRSAGLILPKQRDLYELTRGCRNISLVIVAAESLVRDKRRRPVGTRE